MYSKIIATASALAALALVVPALAAPGPNLPVIGSPGAVSLGAFIPSSNDAKDKGGSTQLDINFQYGLPLIGSLGPLSHTVIGVGVETGTKSGGHSTVIPVTISQMFGVNGQSPTAGGSFYYGVGVGAYFLNQSGISVATRIGGQVEGGYNLTSSIFVDAKYQIVDHADGPIISVGARF
jgi:hypothetical protein